MCLQESISFWFAGLAVVWRISETLEMEPWTCYTHQKINKTRWDHTRYVMRFFEQDTLYLEIILQMKMS